MKHFVVGISVPILLLILAACSPAALDAVPTISATAIVPPPPTPEPTTAPLSFIPATYRDEINGIELDYPSDWSFEPNMQIGSRGSQALLLSPGTTAEALAEGGTRVSITIYEWDPKNDLAAYVTQRRLAWDSGGNTIVSEAQDDLVDGRKAMDFVVRAPDGTQAYFLFTNLGEQYLQIAGEGDLALAAEIAGTFRLLNYRSQ